jgi:hypothetical protein
MGTLMYGGCLLPSGRTRRASKQGKTSRKLKAALSFGRGKVRGLKRSIHSLKHQARELAASRPQNESEQELQQLAIAWLRNKRGRR